MAGKFFRRLSFRRGSTVGEKHSVDCFARVITRDDLQYIHDTWETSCQQQNVPLPKPALNELKKRLTHAAKKPEKAKLSFVNCKLGSKRIELLCQILSKRCLISKLDFRGNELDREGCAAIINMLKCQIKIAQDTAIDQRLDHCFVGELLLDVKNANIATDLSRIRTMAEYLKTVNAEAFIRKIFMKKQLPETNKMETVMQIWCDAMGKVDKPSVLSVYAYLALDTDKPLNYGELEQVVIEGLIQKGYLNRLSEKQRDFLTQSIQNASMIVVTPNSNTKLSATDNDNIADQVRDSDEVGSKLSFADDGYGLVRDNSSVIGSELSSVYGTSSVAGSDVGSFLLYPDESTSNKESVSDQLIAACNNASTQDAYRNDSIGDMRPSLMGDLSPVVEDDSALLDSTDQNDHSPAKLERTTLPLDGAAATHAAADNVTSELDDSEVVDAKINPAPAPTSSNGSNGGNDHTSVAGDRDSTHADGTKAAYNTNHINESKSSPTPTTPAALDTATAITASAALATEKQSSNDQDTPPNHDISETGSTSVTNNTINAVTEDVKSSVLTETATSIVIATGSTTNQTALPSTSDALTTEKASIPNAAIDDDVIADVDGLINAEDSAVGPALHAAVDSATVVDEHTSVAVALPTTATAALTQPKHLAIVPESTKAEKVPAAPGAAVSSTPSSTSASPPPTSSTTVAEKSLVTVEGVDRPTKIVYVKQERTADDSNDDYFDEHYHYVAKPVDTSTHAHTDNSDYNHTNPQTALTTETTAENPTAEGTITQQILQPSNLPNATSAAEPNDDDHVSTNPMGSIGTVKLPAVANVKLKPVVTTPNNKSDLNKPAADTSTATTDFMNYRDKLRHVEPKTRPTGTTVTASIDKSTTSTSAVSDNTSSAKKALTDESENESVGMHDIYAGNASDEELVQVDVSHHHSVLRSLSSKDKLSSTGAASPQTLTADSVHPSDGMHGSSPSQPQQMNVTSTGKPSNFGVEHAEETSNVDSEPDIDYAVYHESTNDFPDEHVAISNALDNTTGASSNNKVDRVNSNNNFKNNPLHRAKSPEAAVSMPMETFNTNNANSNVKAVNASMAISTADVDHHEIDYALYHESTNDFPDDDLVLSSQNLLTRDVTLNINPMFRQASDPSKSVQTKTDATKQATSAASSTTTMKVTSPSKTLSRTAPVTDDNIEIDYALYHESTSDFPEEELSSNIARLTPTHENSISSSSSNNGNFNHNPMFRSKTLSPALTRTTTTLVVDSSTKRAASEKATPTIPTKEKDLPLVFKYVDNFRLSEEAPSKAMSSDAVLTASTKLKPDATKPADGAAKTMERTRSVPVMKQANELSKVLELVEDSNAIMQKKKKATSSPAVQIRKISPLKAETPLGSASSTLSSSSLSPTNRLKSSSSWRNNFSIDVINKENKQQNPQEMPTLSYSMDLNDEDEDDTAAGDKLLHGPSSDEPVEIKRSDYVIVPTESKWSKMTVLDLMEQEVSSDIDFTFYLDPQQYSALLVLILRATLCNDLALMLLARRFSRLTDLDLAHCTLEGPIPKNSLPRSLLRLDLSYNRLTEIDELLECYKLQSLNLSHNKIKAFNSLPQGLTRLDLSHNAISDTFTFRVIAFCNNITDLSISHNPVIQKESTWKVHLRSLLPKLTIIDGKEIPTVHHRLRKQFDASLEGRRRDQGQRRSNPHKHMSMTEQKLHDELRSKEYVFKNKFNEETRRKKEEQERRMSMGTVKSLKADQINAVANRLYKTPTGVKSPIKNRQMPGNNTKFCKQSSGMLVPVSAADSIVTNRRSSVPVNPPVVLTKEEEKAAKFITTWMNETNKQLLKASQILNDLFDVAKNTYLDFQKIDLFTAELAQLEFYTNMEYCYRLDDEIKQLNPTVSRVLIEQAEAVRDNVDHISLLFNHIESTLLLCTTENFALSKALDILMNSVVGKLVDSNILLSNRCSYFIQPAVTATSTSKKTSTRSPTSKNSSSVVFSGDNCDKYVYKVKSDSKDQSHKSSPAPSLTINTRTPTTNTPTSPNAKQSPSKAAASQKASTSVSSPGSPTTRTPTAPPKSPAAKTKTRSEMTPNINSSKSIELPASASIIAGGGAEIVGRGESEEKLSVEPEVAVKKPTISTAANKAMALLQQRDNAPTVDRNGVQAATEEKTPGVATTEATEQPDTGTSTTHESTSDNSKKPLSAREKFLAKVGKQQSTTATAPPASPPKPVGKLNVSKLADIKSRYENSGDDNTRTGKSVTGVSTIRSSSGDKVLHPSVEEKTSTQDDRTFDNAAAATTTTTPTIVASAIPVEASSEPKSAKDKFLAKFSKKPNEIETAAATTTSTAVTTDNDTTSSNVAAVSSGGDSISTPIDVAPVLSVKDRLALMKQKSIDPPKLVVPATSKHVAPAADSSKAINASPTTTAASAAAAEHSAVSTFDDTQKVDVSNVAAKFGLKKTPSAETATKQAAPSAPAIKSIWKAVDATIMPLAPPTAEQVSISTTATTASKPSLETGDAVLTTPTAAITELAPEPVCEVKPTEIVTLTAPKLAVPDAAAPELTATDGSQLSAKDRIRLRMEKNKTAKTT